GLHLGLEKRPGAGIAGDAVAQAGWRRHPADADARAVRRRRQPQRPRAGLEQLARQARKIRRVSGRRRRCAAAPSSTSGFSNSRRGAAPPGSTSRTGSTINTEQPMASSHGKFHWNELMTRNVERAKKFYSETLGWTFDSMPMPGGGTYWLPTIRHAPEGHTFHTRRP